MMSGSRVKVMSFAILFLCIWLMSSVQAGTRSAPTKACKTLSCPQYKVLENHKRYQLRRYEAATWATTDSMGDSLFSVGLGLFMRLFRYRHGNNSLSEKLDMTLPVLRQIFPGKENNTYRYYYMLPSDYQTDPPVPTEFSVRVRAFPEEEFYVRSYSRGSRDSFVEELDNLKQAIGDTSVYESSYFFVASYDLDGLYNEVSLRKTAKKRSKP